jgi:hypothetical protein
LQHADLVEFTRIAGHSAIVTCALCEPDRLATVVSTTKQNQLPPNRRAVRLLARNADLAIDRQRAAGDHPRSDGASL